MLRLVLVLQLMEKKCIIFSLVETCYDDKLRKTVLDHFEKLILIGLVLLNVKFNL